MVTTGISYDTVILLQRMNFTVESMHLLLIYFDYYINLYTLVVKVVRPPHSFKGPERWALTYTKVNIKYFYALFYYWFFNCF